MAKKFFEEGRPHKGMTYNEFMEMSKEKIENTNHEELDDTDKQIFDYTRLNYQRSQRIKKTYKVGEDLKKLVEEIDTPQIWMVITEDWCGDSAQNLPYIAKIAELNDLIDLRILQRDKNLDIMDQYLTNGKSRSIPKLVAFDTDGNELFTWGPRPQALQDEIEKWKQESEKKSDWIEKVHQWYAKNKGRELEAEFKELLENVFSNVN
jgi:hypothetical protein